MEGFGELFKTIGEAISGAIEEREMFGGESGYGEHSQTETYDRVLTGDKRELNVNDR